MPAFNLSSHPATPCEAVRHFQVEALLFAGELLLRYSLEGDVAGLCVPSANLPQREDGLWKRTCFEAFVKMRPGAADYLEFNFAPSGAWAAHRFEAYREGRAAVELEPPTIVMLRGQRLLEQDVRVKLDGLAPPDADLRLGFSAVIEDKSGQLSYWACAHPSSKPNFHHPDSFVCRL
jgi:hypothetical protein